MEKSLYSAECGQGKMEGGLWKVFIFKTNLLLNYFRGLYMGDGDGGAKL